MKLEVTKKINEGTVIKAEFEGKMGQVLRGANALLAFKGKCDLCQDNQCLLQVKSAKGFEFIEFVCISCGARAQWGQYKDGGYFLKQWEKYVPKEGAQGSQQKDNAVIEAALDIMGGKLEEEAPF